MNGIEIESSKIKTLLGVILDEDLKFVVRITSLPRKVAQKLNAFSQKSKYLSYD